MKKPFLRVTKWLGDIPVSAECIACKDAKFTVTGETHRPNKSEYTAKLQQAFDDHVRLVHGNSGPTQPAATDAH